MVTMDKTNEDEFNEWLNSIEFVDKDGNIIEPELTKDTTEDPEGDRG